MMMNQMQPQMGANYTQYEQGLGAGGAAGAGANLTEEELRRLAMLLQQMPANEGLATVTPGEETKMENVFKSGNPMPGTQGLGPGGGPVQSFQPPGRGSGTKEESKKYHDPNKGTGTTDDYRKTYQPSQQTSSTSAVTGKSYFDKDTGYVKKGMELGQDWRGVNERMDPAFFAPRTGTTEKPDQGLFETRPHVIQARNTPEGRSGDWNAHLSAGGSSGGGSSAVSASGGMGEWTGGAGGATATPPPKFFDKDGNEHASAAARTSANKAIDAEIARKRAEDMKRRKEAFTLTPEEIEEFERDEIQVDEPEDAAAITLGEVDEAVAPEVGETTVGEVGEVTAPEIEAVQKVTDEDMDKIFAGGINDAEALLLARVEGTATSPAELQLKRSTENHLRMLLGATAGGDADPAKIRQLKGIWADQQQFMVGEAAEIRSQESMAAEKQLVELYKDKSTMKLNTSLANMETEKQEAFKNGDMELAAKLSNQQAVLTRVITQANINSTAELSEADMKLRTELANLETQKQMAVEQGKMDLATSLANLQKGITIATVNGDLAMKSRLSDDAMAIANYKGQMALEGLEVEVDTVQLQADLQKMGFNLTRDLAEMDAATAREVARLTGEYNSAIAQTNRDSNKENAIIGAIGTAITAYGVYAAAGASDIRAKTNISAADSEVESFLDALNAYQYEYRDPDAPGADAGMFTGIMAQDLEKSPMGASFVQDTPDGKQVDYGHGLAAILAAQANIHERLKELEGA